MPEEASIIGISVPGRSRRGEHFRCFGPIRLTLFRLHVQASSSSYSRPPDLLAGTEGYRE
jgi:hypothetical protein